MRIPNPECYPLGRNLAGMRARQLRNAERKMRDAERLDEGLSQMWDHEDAADSEDLHRVISECVGEPM